jgi:RND family efflux transporter MFP subunit
MLFLNSCQQSDNTVATHTKTSLLKINVHTLKKQSYPLWIDFSAKAEAFNEVAVVSRVKGELIDSNFTAGSFVHKGDILFHIDKGEYQAIYDRQKAILQKDKASLSLSQATIRRYEPLVNEQLAPREKLDQLKANLKELQSLIKADKAELHKAKLNLQYCDIKATIDGYVGKPNYLNGNLVNIGDKLTDIVDSKKLYIHFYPSIKDVVLIKKFSKNPLPKVKVVLNKDDFESVVLEGKVDFIDNMANSSTNTVSMRAVVSNPKGLVYPGSFVHIWLGLGEYSAIAITPNQISQDQEGEFVYIVDKNNSLIKRYIKPIFENSQLVFVDKSLKAGDRVVVGVFHSLVEGSKVKPIEVDNPIKMER